MCLSGPSGSGKTTVIELLALENQWELVEWHEPTLVSWRDVDGRTVSAYEHRLEQFANFLKRANMYV